MCFRSRASRWFGRNRDFIIGQDTTSCGWDLQPTANIHDLLDALDQVENLELLRLHYAHHAHLSREVIKRFGQLEKLIPYIVIPVQNASDRLLKEMRRGLSSYGIRKRIDALRKVNSGMTIRTSIIVGFPGEIDEDFDELMYFVIECEFDRLVVFAYSEEEGTHAANRLKDNVPQQVKYDRMDAIMLAQQEISQRKNESLVGKVERVIIDSHSKDGISIGRTYRDSPEVDNIVQINGLFPVGTFC